MMLRWALMFLVIALISAALGLSGIASISMEVARLLFIVFLVLFVVTALAHIISGKNKPPPIP